MNKKFKLKLGGEMEDEIFDTYEKAEEYACYLQGCELVGAETLEMSNLGDYPMDFFEASEYEIIEVND